jgi:hypothetical protein
MVGMLRIPNRVASCGSASVSSLPSRTWGVERLRCCRELGRHHLAGGAPLRPEIDQQGQLGPGMPIKIRGCERDRAALQKRPAKAATLGLVAKAFLPKLNSCFGTKVVQIA